MSAALAWALRAPRRHDAVLQGLIVGGVGLALGLSTLGVSTLPAQWAPLFVLAILCPFVALVVGNVRRLLLAIILLDIPLQLDINLGYRKEVGELGAVGGLNVSVTTVALGVLYLLWLSERLARGRSQSQPVLRPSLPLVLYLAFAALSVVVARDATLSLFGLFLLLQMFLLYIYVASTVRTRADVLFIVTMLLVGLSLESIVMMGLQVTGQTFALAGVSSRIDAGPTATGASRNLGTLGSPNVAGGYLSLLLAPAIGLLLAPLGRWYQRLAMVAFGLGGVALILTQSRGGWIAFALSITILCVLAWHRGWLPLAVPSVFAVVVVLLSLFFHDLIAARLFGNDAGAAYSRIPLMKLAIRMIKDNPLLGVGANNFAVMIEQYATPEFAGQWLYTVHNRYLIIWAETGIGGLLAFVSFLVVTIRQGWQCWKLEDRLLAPLALGFTAAIIGHMAHMYVDVFNGRLPGQLLWLIAALITALSRMDPLPQAVPEKLGQGRSGRVSIASVCRRSPERYPDAPAGDDGRDRAGHRALRRTVHRRPLWAEGGTQPGHGGCRTRMGWAGSSKP